MLQTAVGMTHGRLFTNSFPSSDQEVNEKNPHYPIFLISARIARLYATVEERKKLYAISKTVAQKCTSTTVLEKIDTENKGSVSSHSKDKCSTENINMCFSAAAEQSEEWNINAETMATLPAVGVLLTTNSKLFASYCNQFLIQLYGSVRLNDGKEEDYYLSFCSFLETSTYLNSAETKQTIIIYLIGKLLQQCTSEIVKMPAHLYSDSFAQNCYSKFISCNHRYTLLSAVQPNTCTEKIITDNKNNKKYNSDACENAKINYIKNEKSSLTKKNNACSSANKIEIKLNLEKDKLKNKTKTKNTKTSILDWVLNKRERKKTAPWLAQTDLTLVPLDQEFTVMHNFTTPSLERCKKLIDKLAVSIT